MIEYIYGVCYNFSLHDVKPILMFTQFFIVVLLLHLVLQSGCRASRDFPLWFQWFPWSLQFAMFFRVVVSICVVLQLICCQITLSSSVIFVIHMVLQYGSCSSPGSLVWFSQYTWFFSAGLVVHMVIQRSSCSSPGSLCGSCGSHGSLVWFSWFTQSFSLVIVVHMVFQCGRLSSPWFTMFFILVMVVHMVLKFSSYVSRSSSVWFSLFTWLLRVVFVVYMVPQSGSLGSPVWFDCQFSQFLWFFSVVFALQKLL